MRIVLLCEGSSEEALKRPLQEYLAARSHVAGRPRVGLDFKRFDGTPSCDQLLRYLTYFGAGPSVIGVIALIDVYPRFTDAPAAKSFLAGCVNASPMRAIFHAHVAQMELEAWLLPFWADIAKRLGVSSPLPGKDPEKVDGQKPPSEHLKALYRRAKVRKGYRKVDEAVKLFRRYSIEKAARDCPELQALLDTLERLCQDQDAKEP